MTTPSYTGFNELMESFSSKGFIVLGFPCAQFYNQEPGKNEEILDCLQYVRPGDGFVPNFPLFQKLDVNGAGTDPIYQWLKSGCANPTQVIGDTQYVSWTPIQYNDITWNFEKFLISRSGQLIRRYTPETFPQLLYGDILDLLASDY